MIKFFESTDAGAPTLNNAVGSMIAVLDACLITGYNSKAVTGITVASGVATVVCTAHAYANTYGKKIRIAGATGSFTALNKDTDIANVTTNGFTFLCPDVADGAATGTITAKYAPLDWTKQYSGTNKAMYKRGDVTATGCMLRVDDNAVGQFCRVLMVQTATDIDTYTNPAPTQIAGGLGQFWCKGYNTAAAAEWFAVSDEKFFYLFAKGATVGGYGFMSHFFGDVIDFKPGSVLGCVLGGCTATNADGNPLSNAPVAGAFTISGGKDGVSTSQNVLPFTRVSAFGATDAALYPSSVDGGLVIAYPVLLFEGSSVNAAGDIRGVIPGLAAPLAKIDNTFPTKQQISNIAGLERNFLVVRSAGSFGSGITSAPLIDLTGPWS